MCSMDDCAVPCALHMALQRQPRPSPDPEYVLRGHRTDVQALLFHPEMDVLYSGSALLAQPANASLIPVEVF